MPGGVLPCASRAPRHVCRGPLERIFGLGGVASSPPSWPPPDPKGAPHEHHRKPDLPVLPGLPTLIGISPLQGSAAGGTQVTLTGTELFCAGVTISGQPPTNLFYNLVGTAPIATTPPGTPGPATVAVTNQIGSASLPGGFTYVAATTTLTATPAVIHLNLSTGQFSIPGQTITFTANPVTLGTTVTDASGTASLTNTTVASTLITTNHYTATFAGSPGQVLPRAPTRPGTGPMCRCCGDGARCVAVVSPWRPCRRWCSRSAV
ncbi:IPT/TIG domain-containing protein [Streptomyces sp. NPDC056697]|uniref:IPT/TIG domain-containing protein n=1 Tax=Streptomyces sp. NPDC056697 TaxID=3345915 RepID=UPI0036A9492C